MNKENTTFGAATISNPNNFNAAYCQYRLPCGYCEKLGRDCPKLITYGSLGSTVALTRASSDDKVFYTNTTALDSIYINNLDKEEK